MLVAVFAESDRAKLFICIILHCRGLESILRRPVRRVAGPSFIARHHAIFFVVNGDGVYFCFCANINIWRMDEWMDEANSLGSSGCGGETTRAKDVRRHKSYDAQSQGTIHVHVEPAKKSLFFLPSSCTVSRETRKTNLSRTKMLHFWRVSSWSRCSERCSAVGIQMTI